MQLKGNPKLALLALVAVFLVALALSIYTLGYTGGDTTVLQGSQTAPGGHIIYVHFIYGTGNFTGTNYTYHPWLNHN
jgi:hypothetical protein